MRFFYGICGIIFLLIVGCSSERATRSSSQDITSSSAAILFGNDTSSFIQRQTVYTDTLAVDSNFNEVTTQLLERARLHYRTAITAREKGDSAQSTTEFEYAIDILSELGYYPNIENNRDFNDLSRSVIEDYEKYIASIDSLGPQTSIFALRQKLNQVDEGSESPDQDAPTKVIATGSVPFVINGHVERNISFFQGRGREHFERWLNLSGKYFPVMKKIFREEGVPEDLVYLSMVESGLNPAARSWAKAVGMWQFVKGTGKLYGLDGNVWYDERRDFEKATHAAARHLKDLNTEFGDWYLALAAYNSGSGRVSSAIRRSRSTDFWKMRPYLPKETRNYVPQFIAVGVMTMDQKAYGFNVSPADSFAFDHVTVNDCVDLGLLAKCVNISAEELRELNPELLQWCTPPGENTYSLRVPAGTSSIFTEKYAAIPDDKKHDWIVHKIRKRDSYASIARKYGITTQLLLDANRFSGSEHLSVGKTIVVPVPASSSGMYATLAPDAAKSPRSTKRVVKTSVNIMRGKEKLTYRIRKGDTLTKIAEWFDVRASDLRVWNEISYGTSIQSGNVLVIWEPKEIVSRYTNIDNLSDEQHSKMLASAAVKESPKQKSSAPTWTKYQVQPGDNLKKIAQMYNVGVEDVRKWNGLRSNTIMTGQTLEVMLQDTSTPTQRPIALAQKDTSKGKKQVSYTVKKGDTLESIASAFGMSITSLKSLNKFRNNRIYAGQAILVNS
ncbi:MAG TPA: LysM peptidoglycan-binding domain-containing protein [Bacteroidota bacterium]|nr:LysM peptidoglycan-binding domain-containing protein [Bacteroidota bacterium]